MKHIQGKNREQTFLFPLSLDQSISKDNEVRLMDLFVDSLSMYKLGFKIDFVENGRPAYHPSDLLKLYIYGYMNKLRTSRDLEKACKRNIEVMWLLKSLHPDHNTISNFRRDNGKAIKKAFRASVNLAKNFHLIGGKLIAGDSTKLRAQNSKKNNFNQTKISQHIEYIDKKLEEYSTSLATEDGQEAELKKDKIKKHKSRKQLYKQLEEQLKKRGDSQISTSDPDSRRMATSNTISEVVYNIQASTDEKYKIPIDYKVTSDNDTKAMGNMLQRAKAILRTNEFTVLYDKGYHTGSELKTATDLDIDVLVSIVPHTSQAPDPSYNVECFDYNKEKDCYTCPEGEILLSSGRWYKGKNYWFKQYKTKACLSCCKKVQCTASKKGKVVQRSEYAEYIEKNKQNIENQRELYKKRQAIVEHPFGTIKRQWGFHYILTKKGIERANADVGLMFLAYNLRRIINIIGKEGLKTYLETSIFNSFRKIRSICLNLSLNKLSNYIGKLFSHTIEASFKTDYIWLLFTF